jgi:hypothetical protein
VAERVPVGALVVVVGAVVGAAAVVVGGEVVVEALGWIRLLLAGAAIVVNGRVVAGTVVLDAPAVPLVVEVTDPELLRPAREMVAGAVWKLSTPARPSSVPAMTNGERFTIGASSSEGELL